MVKRGGGRGEILDSLIHSIATSEGFVLPTGCWAKFRKGMKDNLFTIFTLIGVAIGFGIGFGVGSTKPSEVAIEWISESNISPLPPLSTKTDLFCTLFINKQLIYKIKN